MGTRSLTHVIETYKHNGKKKKQTLLTMYRQYDGYPRGHGADLVEFLEGSRVVNGYSKSDTESEKRVFNGTGCLAAQLVAHFKKGIGGFYLHRPNAKDCGEEYTYDIEVDSDTNQVTLRCYEIGYMNKKNEYVNKKCILFEGKAEAFLEAVKVKQEA
jgi:hypothetical protein